MRHVPVLLNEVVEYLNLAPNKNIIDCTLGDAGHSESILKKTGPKGKLLGIDADSESLLRAQQFLHQFGDRVTYARDNFVRLQDIVKENNFGPTQGILLDLGWSTPQFEDRGRGFSFRNLEEPLNMRYFQRTKSKEQGTNELTASELVNTFAERDLEKIFRDYGEEKLSKEIAKAIVEKRKIKNIEIVGDLVEIVLVVYRKKLKSDKEVPWVGGLHPATKVFQAIRIAVNDELGVLKAVLPQAIEVLESGGRLAVITFHSLEDRIVKHYFKSQENKTIHLINKKPIEASPEEKEQNSPSRSAKLRVIEKL